MKGTRLCILMIIGSLLRLRHKPDTWRVWLEWAVWLGITLTCNFFSLGDVFRQSTSPNHPPLMKICCFSGLIQWRTHHQNWVCWILTHIGTRWWWPWVHPTPSAGLKRHWLVLPCFVQLPLTNIRGRPLIFSDIEVCSENEGCNRYPPGNDHISHLGKRTSIDSKIPWDGICASPGRYLFSCCFSTQ